MRLFSPAKINLFMRVLGKRQDGYHEIATLLQAIDLGDFITFELAERDQLISSDPTLPLDEKNLIFKAARLFRQKTGLTFGLKVDLEKHIPIEAGLGGGSSNAATTLWALNQLCGTPASIEDLILWSGEIGSDITFFLSQGIAYCTGRGEKIRLASSLSSLTLPQLWIIKPKEGLSTPAVFKKLNFETCSRIEPEVFYQSFYSGDSQVPPLFFNDLECSAFEQLARLRDISDDLSRQGYSSITMTGSGSSLYCFGEGLPNSIADAQIFPTKFLYREPQNWYDPTHSNLTTRSYVHSG